MSARPLLVKVPRALAAEVSWEQVPVAWGTGVVQGSSGHGPHTGTCSVSHGRARPPLFPIRAPLVDHGWGWGKDLGLTEVSQEAAITPRAGFKPDLMHTEISVLEKAECSGGRTSSFMGDF
jgi:hypothetical protein